jgi:hypothetical protein
LEVLTAVFAHGGFIYRDLSATRALLVGNSYNIVGFFALIVTATRDKSVDPLDLDE